MYDDVFHVTIGSYFHVRSSYQKKTFKNLKPKNFLTLIFDLRANVATKTIRHYTFHLRRAATLPWEIENLNFLQIFSTYERKCKQIPFKCTDFNSCMRMTVYWVYLYVFIKILSSSLNTMLTVDKHCSDVCCDEFSVPQIDRNVKRVKQQ